MSWHRGYSDDDTDTPLEWWLTAHDARVKARRAFVYGSVICGVLGFGAGMAWGETIAIGRTYINGTMTGSTTVTLAPSDVPGELATVTLDNRLVNQGSDTGTYFLSIEGLTVEVDFTWDQDPLLGSDSITVYPPAGIICEPESCSVVVMEGLTGAVVLHDWRGM